jgi:hypothetical protein
MTWTPLTRDELRQTIAEAGARMSTRQRRLWDAIRIDPEKWSQSPYGDAGGGFWVVGIIGGIVIWYNDVEDGFDRSHYTLHGSITDYTCNQFELDTLVEQLLSFIETGHLAGEVRGPPQPVFLPPR